MTEPSFPDDYHTDVETLTAAIDGHPFDAYDPQKDHFECDFCSKGVPYAAEPHVAQYWVDRLPHAATPEARAVNAADALAPMGTYCPDCSTRRLLFPCEGYTEVRLFVTIDAERTMRTPEVTDISPADDGIPWDPAAVSEAITRIPFDTHAAAAPDVMMAPENVVTFFLSIGAEIDIRELVDYTGEIDPKALGQVRKSYREFAARVGTNKQAFREHVRDHWGDPEA